MIVDDIRASQARNDKKHVLTLLHVLHHFLENASRGTATERILGVTDFAFLFGLGS